MLFLGIDAGGSKAAFALCDSSGNVIGRYESKSQGAFALGLDGIETLVREGSAQVCQVAGVKLSDVTWAGAGFPGYGEERDNKASIDAACLRALGGVPIKCECDCYLGWAGSLAMQPGVNIVSGTGSIGYGVNGKGQSARSGGWGAYCDEGSCTWIGQRLVAEFAKQSDGRKPRTLLYEMFRNAWQIDEDTHFIHTLNHVIARTPGETARMQILAEQAARAGDPEAQKIYASAAWELCQTAVAVAQKLDLSGPDFLVSYSGGLFKAGSCILEPLAQCMNQAGGRLIAPVCPPELGAVFMAMRAYDEKMDVVALSERIKENGKPKTAD
jgi:N-acetylglucosamine kinase-like BadF-type ATPase